MSLEVKEDRSGNAASDNVKGSQASKNDRNRRRRRRGGKDHSGSKAPNHRVSARNDQTDPAVNRFTSRGVYSAIDLGTNNCRLLIAKPTRQGFRVIDAFSRIVRLGEGVSQNNRLSDEAMDRTIAALKVCAEKIARRNVTCMRHVATEACRVADNAEEFVARVKAETGINLDIISTGEEARLAVMGCQSLIAPGNKNALVFDIGGGSTELIWVRVLPGGGTEMRGWMSIPWGVVNLSEEYGEPGVRLPDEQYARMVGTVKDHLIEFEEAHDISEVVRRKKTQFLGTSGTVTTLASLHLELPRYIREKVDGAWMKSEDIKSLSRRVAQMTHEERSAQPCIGSERADLVVAGCAILEAILGMWQVPSLRVADRGIREGILRGLMQTGKMPIRADRRGKNKRRRNNG
ncbi:Ppx/GppA family phosphatase [Kordiimonas sp. SCSIO 12603]|uniref:Ppx/GppA phosphatase family protein n=1 Tax=Kordiimonas sp. SCSIO 12603 TaxID=2829596 RepID=UPI0021055C6D|nr:Ppx/GppA phosphatase family protein [Kordiimonas sp. SCSIO 12603]UTW57272.1 Ppx/GppA family phosphatase [Kordiimonas sp. SCSIO 12603]